jgi:hypothetical protein
MADAADATLAPAVEKLIGQIVSAARAGDGDVVMTLARRPALRNPETSAQVIAALGFGVARLADALAERAS